MEFVIGILCGALLSLFFSIGPAFFSLIQNSIHHGFQKTVSFAAGISLSDLIIVVLMLTALSNIDLNALMHNVYVASIGGVAIGIFGVLTYRSKVKKVNRKDSRLRFKAADNTNRWQLMLHGFLLNILNPLIWLYWVTIITFLSAEMELTNADRFVFFFGLLVGTFGTDVLKCRLAAMLQTWFTARRLNLFNKITGGILIAFSLYLIVSMILYQTNPKIRAKEDASPSRSTILIERMHNMTHRDTTKDCDTVSIIDSLQTDTSLTQQ